MRITFMPPPVEPAQAPMHEPISSNNGKGPGQTYQASVVKPVVVPMETAWNSP